MLRKAQKSANTIADVKTDVPSRRLKVEATGDPWLGKVTSKIRLKGRWLEQAGFRPGDQVEVTLGPQGNLNLKVIEPEQEVIRETPWCNACQTTCQLTLWKQIDL